jgi:hypothetical protein
VKGARAHVSATMAGRRSAFASDAVLAREAPRGSEFGMEALHRQGMRRCTGHTATVYQGMTHAKLRRLKASWLSY